MGNRSPSQSGSISAAKSLQRTFFSKINSKWPRRVSSEKRKFGNFFFLFPNPQKKKTPNEESELGSKPPYREKKTEMNQRMNEQMATVESPGNREGAPSRNCVVNGKRIGNGEKKMAARKRTFFWCFFLNRFFIRRHRKVAIIRLEVISSFSLSGFLRIDV